MHAWMWKQLSRLTRAHTSADAALSNLPPNLLSCRFDVRALLDFYKEPDPRVLAARQKSHEELKLEEVGSTHSGNVVLSTAWSSAAEQDSNCICMGPSRLEHGAAPPHLQLSFSASLPLSLPLLYWLLADAAV